MRHWLFLSVALLGLLLALDQAFCAGCQEVIAEFENGSINWSRGIVQANGLGGPCRRLPDGSRQEEEAIADAWAAAKKNLLRIVEKINIDSRKTVGSLFEKDPEIRDRLLNLIDSVQPSAHHRILPGDFAEVSLSLSMHGPFSQIVLPSEIKQIDSIRPVGPAKTPPAVSGSGEETTRSEPHSDKSPVHSGMIVDAKGLVEVKPALVPQIVDEAGNEIYGPAFVSREYAIESGMGIYLKRIHTAKSNSRVEPNPLIVKGLKTESDGSSTIVVSNADASRLRHTSEHFSFLKQCRVIIIVD